MMPRRCRGPRTVAASLLLLLAVIATAGLLTGCDGSPPLAGAERRRAAGRRGTREVADSDPAKATLSRSAPDELRRLFNRGGWTPVDGGKNRQGMWELVHDKTQLHFIYVPGGSFMMGNELGDSDAMPVHEVTLSPFMLCKTEVHQEAWDEVGGDDDRTMEGATLPINRLIWDEARIWCSNAGFRLPTEAEWEYAARCGSAETWVSGNKNAMGNFAWFHENSDNEVHPVGTKRPNRWGFHDMAGNVAEFCQDVYAIDYRKCPTDGSAMKTGGEMRVLRGGNYSNDLRSLESTYRNRNGPFSRDGGPGVRPAVTLR